MTARNGFSDDMYRFPLDAGAAEQLIAGSVDIADAPPLYRAVALRLGALRAAPQSWELAGERDAVEQIAAAIVLERQARLVPRPRRSSSRVAALAATALVACALPLTGGLASAGALPEPAQKVTSVVLDTVGISVPTGAHDPADDAPPPPSSVPAPPTTTGSSTGGAGASPGAAGSGPDVVDSSPVIPSPPAPGNGGGEVHGTRARGTPPGRPDGQVGPHERGNGNANGNGRGR